MVDRVAVPDLREDAVDLGDLVRRHEHGDVPADDLGGGIPVDLLRARVPADDGAVERLADDRVVRAVDDRGKAGPLLLGLLPLGDIPRGREDPGDPAGLVPVDGRVVDHGREPPARVADLEFVVPDGARPERGLVPGLRLFGLGKVGREVGADQLLPGTPGDLCCRLVHVGDRAVGTDGDEGVEARLDQAPVVRAFGRLVRRGSRGGRSGRRLFQPGLRFCFHLPSSVLVWSVRSSIAKTLVIEDLCLNSDSPSARPPFIGPDRAENPERGSAGGGAGCSPPPRFGAVTGLRGARRSRRSPAALHSGPPERTGPAAPSCRA